MKVNILEDYQKNGRIQTPARTSISVMSYSDNTEEISDIECGVY